MGGEHAQILFVFVALKELDVVDKDNFRRAAKTVKFTNKECIEFVVPISNQFDESEPAKLLITSPKNTINLISPIQFSKAENDFKPQCHWNNWSSWSDCTITCGDHAGRRRRVRSQRGSKFCVLTTLQHNYEGCFN